MAKKTGIVIPERFKSYLKVLVYLLISGILAFVSAKYLAEDENLAIIFQPAINLALVILNKEIGSLKSSI